MRRIQIKNSVQCFTKVSEKQPKSKSFIYGSDIIFCPAECRPSNTHKLFFSNFDSLWGPAAASCDDSAIFVLDAFLLIFHMRIFWKIPISNANSLTLPKRLLKDKKILRRVLSIIINEHFCDHFGF